MRQYRMLPMSRIAAILFPSQTLGPEQNRTQTFNIVLNVFGRNA